MQCDVPSVEIHLTGRGANDGVISDAAHVLHVHPCQEVDATGTDSHTINSLPCQLMTVPRQPLNKAMQLACSANGPVTERGDAFTLRSLWSKSKITMAIK